MRGQVLHEHNSTYVFSPEKNESFDLPPGTGLVPGDVIEFDVQNDSVVRESIRKITAPPTTLVRITVEDEQVGSFGKYRWKSYWQLDSPSLSGGYIIQTIRWLTAYTPLRGQPFNHLDRYQEAWQVAPGACYTQKFNQENREWREAARRAEQENPDGEAIVEMPEMPDDDEIAQDEPIESKQGFIIIQATAQFYEGLALPQDFIVNNPATLADALPSRVGENTNDLVAGARSITAPSSVTVRLDWKADGNTEVKKS
jgi:hypothetical protein